LVAFNEVGSTNDEAKRLAEAGAEDGTLVWAQSQTRGRGRRDASFVSPPGNLYATLVLRPDCPPMQAAQLSFVAALGVGDALARFVPPLSEIVFKWPNDVLLNERKVAGILLESSITAPDRLDWLVVGIGVNLVSAPDDTAFPATSLRDEGCGAVDVAEALESLCRHFQTWANRWLDDGFAPVRQAWLRQAKGIGEDISVNLQNESVSCRFVDLDGTGSLVVELPGGERRSITAGEVFFGADS
jgi:BirA family biotin operon repressor/biotin-[acetyl-CoA-carboxylase] ligase